jgi:hypothetical protein
MRWAFFLTCNFWDVNWNWRGHEILHSKRHAVTPTVSCVWQLEIGRMEVRHIFISGPLRGCDMGSVISGGYHDDDLAFHFHAVGDLRATCERVYQGVFRWFSPAHFRRTIRSSHSGFCSFAICAVRISLEDVVLDHRTNRYTFISLVLSQCLEGGAHTSMSFGSFSTLLCLHFASVARFSPSFISTPMWQ